MQKRRENVLKNIQVLQHPINYEHNKIAEEKMPE